MPQRDRTERKEPVHQMLVRCVNIGRAAVTINEILDGQTVPIQRERAAYKIWDKLVPSMAAVQVDVRDHRPQSVHDLNAMLLSNGLDALPAPGQVIDSTGNSPVALEHSEEGAPPDSDT